MDLSPEQREVLLEIARATIRECSGGPPSVPLTPTDSSLLELAGCFVSLHSLGTHRLRGCIGRLEADRPLHQVVRDVAASVVADPRFADEPVRFPELGSLELEISILSPPRPAAPPAGF